MSGRSYAIEAVARQYGAAIDALENAIVACPDEVWGDRPGFHEFWYLAFHTLFWLDYYLSGTAEGFRPPAPYGLEEMDPAGVLPPRVYSKAEMLSYLAHGREKCRAVMTSLTDELAARPCGFPRREGSWLELHIYSLRHVQHHVAQLQLLMRQAGHEPPRWVGRSSRTWHEA